MYAQGDENDSDNIRSEYAEVLASMILRNLGGGTLGLSDKIAQYGESE